MLEKFQPIKIARLSYWLNAFLAKSKPILTEKVYIINIIAADVIDADILIIVFRFSIFRKPVCLKY